MIHHDSHHSTPGDPAWPGLIQAVLSDNLSEPQLAELNQLLKQNAQARRELVGAMLTSQLLEARAHQNQVRQAVRQDTGLIDALQCLDQPESTHNQIVDLTEQMRRRAEAVEKVNQHQTMLSDSLKKHHGFKKRIIVIPKPVFYSAVAATAAVLLLIIHPLFRAQTPTPAPQEAVLQPIVVAKLHAQIDAQWRQTPADSQLQTGDYELQAGLAEIVFPSGASMIVQGPTRFSLDAEKAATLKQGKLVGRCPTQASQGLVIRTPKAKIVDLGTEFGVAVDAVGRTDAHVFVGRIAASIVNAQGDTIETVTLKNDQAARLDKDIIPIFDTDELADQFARKMVKQIDLADIIAGGDGRTHFRHAGVDPLTGRMTQSPPGVSEDDFTQLSDGQYHPVWQSPFIDGVLIANGSQGPVQINSTGQSVNLPETSGYGYGYVWAGGAIPVSQYVSPISGVLNHIDYTQPNKGLISLHANLGVTFDLRAVTQRHAGLAPTRFVSVLGVTNDYPERKVDIWIFADGQLLFNRRGMTSRDRHIDLDIALPTNTRFLTLISTDGGDIQSMDWVVYGQPRLELAIDGQSSNNPTSSLTAFKQPRKEKLR